MRLDVNEVRENKKSRVTVHLKHTQHIREKQENKFRERLAPSALYQKKTVMVFEFSRENEAGLWEEDQVGTV